MADGARRADLAALLAIALFALAAARLAWSYGLWQGFEPGPGLFALLAASATAALALASAAQLVFGSAQPAATDDAAAPNDRRRLAIYLAVIVLWPWLLMPLGYLVSTGLAFLVLLRFAERCAWTTTAAVLVLALGASWVLFVHLLQVPLPRGVLAAMA